MPTQKGHGFYDILTRAVEDVVTNGYDSAERIAFWTEQLRRAADSTMRSAEAVNSVLRDALASVYRRLVERRGALSYHPGVSTFTLDRIRPQLRSELDRRILASASIIRLNRENAMATTLRRFQGWATSIPQGGTDAAQVRRTKVQIAKPIARQKFEERRVVIDQSHKLTAAINNIVATDGGAIALVWRSHWRERGYDYREDHKERDGHVYLMRDSWAADQGFVKPDPKNGYYDQITAVGEEVFCRCYARYIYALRDLPAHMLTRKGEAAQAQARAQVQQRMIPMHAAL